MKRLHWQLDRDGLGATVTLPTDPPVAMRLDAVALDDLLRTIGDVRASLQPGHDKTWPPGSTVVAEPDPGWMVEAMPPPEAGDDADPADGADAGTNPGDVTDARANPQANAQATTEASADPAPAVSDEGGAGQVLVHLRDPRYGWLHYLLPRTAAQELAARLLMQSGGDRP